MRQGHGSAHHLIGILGVNTELQSHIDSLIEFGVRSGERFAHGVFNGKTLGKIDAFHLSTIFLPMSGHSLIPFLALVVSNLLPGICRAVRPNPTKIARRGECANLLFHLSDAFLSGEEPST